MNIIKADRPSVRVCNALEKIGFSYKDRGRLVDVIKSGKISKQHRNEYLYKDKKIKNFGDKSFDELCLFLGMPLSVINEY